MADKPNALIMMLSKKPPPGGKTASQAAGLGGGQDDYDSDLAAELDDLAAALGVTVKDSQRGVEALKAIHQTCEQAMADEEGTEEP